MLIWTIKVTCDRYPSPAAVMTRKSKKQSFVQLITVTIKCCLKCLLAARVQHSKGWTAAGVCVSLTNCMMMICLTSLMGGGLSGHMHITVQSNRVDSCSTGLNDVWQCRGGGGHRTCLARGSWLDKQGSAPIKLPSDKLWSDTNGQISCKHS